MYVRYCVTIQMVFKGVVTHKFHCFDAIYSTSRTNEFQISNLVAPF